MKSLAIVLIAACTQQVDYGTSADDLSSENGVSLNGVSLNGVSLNGVSLNGLEPALATEQFSGWFNTDIDSHEAEMRYVMRCMRPAGSVVTYTNPDSGITYTWEGNLGLAPTWTDRALTTDEQEVLTACMLAHANKYGIHVAISVSGEQTDGTPLEQEADEDKKFSVKEAAFFGNMQNGDGAFVCLDHPRWPHNQSTARACGFDSDADGSSSVCPPVYQVGDCSKFCKKAKSAHYYESCTFEGKTYHPLTTRLRPQDMYRCGDGVCQFTEHCGTGGEAWNCKADCGVCN